jgi:CRP/FNR family transcriptional regulator, anaerobic regulatory protein
MFLETTHGNAHSNPTSHRTLPAQRSSTQGDAVSLTESDLQILNCSRQLHRVITAGHDIVQQGDRRNHIYVLLEGWAFCYKILEDGHRQILDLALPGSVLGFHFSKALPYGVEAKTTCKIAVYSRETFLSALLKAPDLCLKCAELFAYAETRAFNRLSRVGRLGARERVAGLVVELVERLHANGINRSVQLDVPLTQQDIADMLGLANETVCRALMSLRKQRLTTWHNGKLEIHNLEALIDVAGEDTDSVECSAEQHEDGAALQMCA